MRTFLKTLRNWIFPVSEQQILNQIVSANWNNNTASGLSITPEGNLTVSTVWQAVSVISHPLSAMEFNVYRRTIQGKQVDRDSKIYDLLNWRANPEQTSLKLKETMMLHVLLYGNAYVEIVRDEEGQPVELWNLNPTEVQPQRTKRGGLFYIVRGKRCLPENIIHLSKLAFDGVIGYSLTQIGKEGIALAKSLELFGATFFGNNCLPSGFIQSDKALGNPQQVLEYEQELNRNYGGMANANKIKVLKPGQTWVPNNGVGMGEQSQFTASRQFQALEICRYLNLDPARVGAAPVPTDIESYNTLFYQNTIQPWAELIEAEFNSKLFTDLDRKTTYAELDFSSMLRANSNARADYFTKMFNLGAVTTNHIISSENLGDNIGEAGDLHFIPANNLTSLEQILAQMQAPVPDATGAAPPEPVKTPVIASNKGLEAVRTVVEESINRMVRRESEAIQRFKAKAPDEFRAACDAFYAKHETIIRENIGPAVRAFVAVSNSDESAEALIDAIAAKLCQESKEQVFVTDDVAALFDHWAKEKAREIVEVL